MKSEFSVGLADKICAAWDCEDGTPVELNSFAENGSLISGLLSVLRGNAVIKPVAVPAEEAVVTSKPESLWKKVSDTAINVNLGFSPKLPFDGAVIEKHVGDGWVLVEKRANGLYVAGTKVALYSSKRQQNGKWIKGYELREDLTGKPVLNANVLDALYENPHLIPKDWKRDENGNVRYVFFWGTIYRNPRTAYLFVRYLCFVEGVWHRHYDWLDRGWHGGYPAALLAS